jgi:CSLREA domain-containing protein
VKIRYVVLLMLGLYLASTLCLAAPPNDNWVNREVIGTLPYSSSITVISTATNGSGDPRIFCDDYGGSSVQENSIWYTYSTGGSDAYVNISASGYDSILAVYEGNPTDGFHMVTGGCNDDDDITSRQAGLRGLRLRAGGSYSIMVAAYGSQSPSASLSFSFETSPLRQVTKQADSDDGVCDSDCSLREAIGANVLGPPGAVLIPAGHYVVQGGLSLFTNSSNKNGIAIYGAGIDETVIDANFSGRVINGYLASPSRAPTILISGLSLINGVASSRGGAIESNHGYLILDHVGVRNNTAATNGGGLYSFMETTVTTVSTSIIDSEFTQNRTLTGSAGGLFIGDDRAEILNTLVSDNEALASPIATGCGGARLRNIWATKVVNSTFSGNRTNGTGSGLCAEMQSFDLSSFVLRNNTIVNNYHNIGGASSVGGGLSIDQSLASGSRPFRLDNSVIAGNRAGSELGIAGDCQIIGLIGFSTAYNLAQVPGNCSFAGAGDVVGLDPLLLPLSSVDSPHPVHVPTIGSPLIDQGDPGSGCAVDDARGVLRPQDGDGDMIARCDIGAVEKLNTIDLIFVDGFD